MHLRIVNTLFSCSCCFVHVVRLVVDCKLWKYFTLLSYCFVYCILSPIFLFNRNSLIAIVRFLHLIANIKLCDKFVRPLPLVFYKKFSDYIQSVQIEQKNVMVWTNIAYNFKWKGNERYKYFEYNMKLKTIGLIIDERVY